ncbi:MAG: dihydrofolate reductase [Betaproteobacteria bacterium]|nr:MAG: dihydrofolate reductase [Betaproteobacteria bacterium]
MTARICLVVAMAANRVIGKNNALPWHLPPDLRRFKALTLGHPVVMGRKTHESIGKPLPGRRNLVITRNRDYLVAGCEVVHSLDAALAACADAKEIYIIGGAELYRESLPHAQRLEFTEIHAEFDGDAHFPEYSPAEWLETRRETHGSEAGIPFRYDFVCYDRVT